MRTNSYVLTMKDGKLHRFHSFCEEKFQIWHSFQLFLFFSSLVISKTFVLSASNCKIRRRRWKKNRKKNFENALHFWQFRTISRQRSHFSIHLIGDDSRQWPELNWRLDSLRLPFNTNITHIYLSYFDFFFSGLIVSRNVYLSNSNPMIEFFFLEQIHLVHAFAWSHQFQAKFSQSHTHTTQVKWSVVWYGPK